jgi:hypothetical protein
MKIKSMTKQIKPAVGVIAGSIAADVLANKAIPASLPPIVKRATPILLGLFLMGQKGEFIKNLGAGMVANAGTLLAKSTIPGLAGICESDMDGMFEDIAEDIAEDISEDIADEYTTLNDSYETLNESII